MRLARLALIAEYLNEAGNATTARDAIKRLVEPWLNQTNENKLYHDSLNGGIVTDVGLTGLVENAINERYDNHHYDYGYMIYAIAVLGKEDPAFIQKYK